jgi:hypothetical protein
MILGSNRLGLTEISHSWALYLDGCKMCSSNIILQHDLKCESTSFLSGEKWFVYHRVKRWRCLEWEKGIWEGEKCSGHMILDLLLKKVKLWEIFINHYNMKSCGRVMVQLRTFLFSALAGIEWSAWCFDLFNPEERASGTHWIRRRACGTLETSSM